MKGLLQHLALTLRLNFRSKQAIVYGYVVPIFFLLAFGCVFRSGNPPLVREMGQLLTITVLGGACFGMPTAIVAERERGVWRRYRLLPAAIGGIILSSMIARFVIVVLGGLLQIVLARVIFGTTPPNHPLALAAVFTFVSFAFLGMGLVIAMLADTVPAVQALGQAVFLPMIMIGGVGVPLRILPPWAQHVAGFLPGRYAVEAMQACINGPGLAATRFDLLALTTIGLAACLAGAKLFRWDAGQHIAGRAWAWVTVAVVAWAGVGLAAERSGRLSFLVSEGNPARGGGLLTSILGSRGGSATTQAAGRENGPFIITQREPWEAITDADIKKIEYDDLPPDNSTEGPVAANLDDLDDDTLKRIDEFAKSLDAWEPGNVADIGQRVRYLMALCGMVDHTQHPLESFVPYVVFQRLRDEVPKDKLVKALGWVITQPDAGKVIEDAKELGFETGSYEEMVRIRTTWYAKKLLWRVLELGKTK